MSSAALDNPIWSALNSAQSDWALGGPLARRFPADVAPFGGLLEQSAEAYQALEAILPGATTALFLSAPPQLPPGWQLLHGGQMYQMTVDQPIDEDVFTYRQLHPADVPEILALTRLTEPGPFLARTIHLGSYFGIYQQGRLAAMAGERLHLTGFTEISAVCTHPDFRGRGFGNALLSMVRNRILARGEMPFLHVRASNATAIRLYQKQGFAIRARLHLAVVKYP
jgi:ribosomal protein S18 acetylase RimI-like enzyme